MRILMFTITTVFAVSLIVPAVAANGAVPLTWEQCHIQTLRHGLTPLQRAYANHMLHCLAWRPGK
jgi:hypothetical protein